MPRDLLRETIEKQGLWNKRRIDFIQGTNQSPSTDGYPVSHSTSKSAPLGRTPYEMFKFKKGVTPKADAFGASSSEYDYMFKVLLLGDSEVGKSTMLLRYTDGVYNNSYISTIGYDFKLKTISYGDKTVKLQIWDSKQDKFKTAQSAFTSPCQGIVLVYDVTDQRSFNNIREWLKENETYGSHKKRCVLVGTKGDLATKRQVEYGDGAKLATEFGIPFLETSSVTGANINDIFATMASEVLYSRAGVPSVKTGISYAPDPFLPTELRSDALNKMLAIAYKEVFWDYQTITEGRYKLFGQRCSPARATQISTLNEIITTSRSSAEFIDRVLELKDTVHADHVKNSFWAKIGASSSALEGALDNMLNAMSKENNLFSAVKEQRVKEHQAKKVAELETSDYRDLAK